jgi:hypothetical protein
VFTPSEAQLEIFAEAYARGARIKDAGLAAGYSAESKAMYRRFHSDDFQERVKRHQRALIPAETPDLVPVIDRLMKAADAAVTLKSAAAMKAACDLLAEAARLKRLLPLDQPDQGPRYEMTREEWLATFAPRPG